ncbi:MAG TPA: DUF882 domain-containing protein [Stellaceae bacterium]|nr:DUF882 domain-containing protein [Stellaceae bacterium]
MTVGLGRRRLLAAAAGVACLAAAPALAVPRMPQRRALALSHRHTGERLALVYWADGRYVPGALRRIDWLLRDYRTGEVHPIDPRLLDLLAALGARLGVGAPIEIVSGYRSPATNAILARESEAVATNSLHMSGRAIDIRVPGRSTWAVRQAALALRGGGVGYYPRSEFVHIDVGSVRHW